MRAFWQRIGFLLRYRRTEDELREEIETHRALAQDALERDGVERGEAEALAQRALGNDLAARDRARDVWIWPSLQDLSQDIRFGVRLLLKDVRFTATVVGVLALGLGVNHLFVTLIYAHTLRGLPIERADRVLWVATFDDRRTDRQLSYPEFDDLRTQARNFQGLTAYTNAPVVIAEEGRPPDRFGGVYVSGNGLMLAGVRPVLGRIFSIEDDEPGAAPVVMLGHGAWHARYGGDASVIGRSVLVNGRPSTVIGIVPTRSGFPSVAQVWLPLHQLPGIASQPRILATLQVFGRLRDDVTVSDGRSEIEALVERSSLAHPDTNKSVRARVTTINERFFGRFVGPWLAFTTAGFLVLIVSAANVANLLLARSVQRSREMAVRASLGASRGRVVRQLIAEAGVLALLGSGVGFVLALGGVRLFEQAVPPNLLPYWFYYSLDLRMFLFLVGVALLTLLLFGVAPALHASKTDVNLVLKDSSRTGIGRRGASRWRAAFLTAQLALSTVLLTQLAVALRTDIPDLPTDVALASSDVLTASLTLPGDRFPDADSRAAFHQRVLERVRTMPGVASATVTSVLPRRGGVERSVEIAGAPDVTQDAAHTATTVSIAADYFDALGFRILRGRALTDEDGRAPAIAAVVNEAFVNRFLPDGEPIGQRVVLSASAVTSPADPMSVTIVGVAPDIRQRQAQRADAIVYLPLARTAQADAALIVRARGAGGVAAADLRTAALDVDASIPLYRMMTMAASIDEMDWNGRTSYTLVSLVTWVSIALAAVGLYAVTAYSVSERTQEIGLRMALGARAAQVSGLVFRRAAVQVGIGLVFGILGAVAWDRAFATTGSAELRAADPLVLLVICGALTAITVLACLAPALRAMRLDPLVALRHE